MSAELQFFNPYSEIRLTANRLPHWQQKGGVYFVTFRLIDALPHHLRTNWQLERETWLSFHPKPWTIDTELEYHRRFSGTVERWLDAGYGSCLLRRGDCSKVMVQALRHFDGDRLVMISSVVMPNHVHALFVQNPDWPLEKLLRSWKSFSCRKINSLLARGGGLWQRDYFDRLIRDETHLGNCVRYIRRNPEKAKINASDYVLYESDLARAVE